MPLPPGGPSPAPLSLLARLLRYRFFLLALVVILFLAGLFAWKPQRPGHPAAEAQPPTAQGYAGALEQGKEPLPPAPAAEAKSPEAEQPAPETRAPAAEPPAPQVIPSREPAKGEIFTRALIKIMTTSSTAPGSVGAPTACCLANWASPTTSTTSRRGCWKWPGAPLRC
jgi:type IV secretory pathway VirB10-like protein